MRILVAGGEGFVGRNLAREFRAFGHHVHALGKSTFNIGDESCVKSVLAALEPDVVVNAAGTKDLRGCEEHSTRALHLNAYAPAMLARVCRDKVVKFVHIGSDHAYGTPKTAYGDSKLAGDQMIWEANATALVAVTGHCYAADCPWIRWLDGELRAGREVEAWADIVAWPTYLPNLAAMIMDLVARNICGLRACVGGQRVNRWELFQLYAMAAGLDASLIVPAKDCPSPLHMREVALPVAYCGKVRRMTVAEGIQTMCRNGKAVAA